MVQIRFDNQEQYTFATQFFQAAGGGFSSATLSSDTLTIGIDEPTIGMLLRRISQGETAVMPYIGKEKDTWIIAGADQRALDQTMRAIKRFLIPTYAEFTPTGHIPSRQTFDPTSNHLQQAGATIYPAGYYRMVSHARDRSFILKRLALWGNLETTRPTHQVEQHQSYRGLAEAFQEALAAANWTEAEQCLQEMQRLHLSTANNLAFLSIQLLAQQHRWSEIWHHTDFALLARMRIPRSVRAALLTAFHHSELLGLEQEGEWGKAFETFKRNRSKLGLLLTGRFGLSQASVVQVFAYQAVLDADHTSLESLRSIQDDPQVQVCLDNLHPMLPVEKVISKPLTDPEQQVKQALLFSDYDTALHAVKAIEQQTRRATLLVEVAFHSGDLQTAEDALLTYWELKEDEQHSIQQKEPRISHYLDFLNTTVSPPQDKTIPTIGNWLDWFQLVQDNPDSPHLVPALDHLVQTKDERFWTIERIVRLNDALLLFVTDPEYITRPYARNAIQNLINLFLQDSGFPRSDDVYDSLYETLYLGVLETHTPNITTSMLVFRLISALLSNKPERCHSIWQNLSSWFQEPVPALETSVQEIFELLIDYGLPGNVLTEWYRRWVEYLVSLPTSRDRVILETWLAFGKWMQTVPNLVSRLQERLTDSIEQDWENPIEKLPDGYRIGIFSLRESSAQRVKLLLEARNNSLDVRICTEKVLNERAKAIAQNADLVVVAWTCLSHAMSYGIEPFLKNKPVFPQSGGSTSMVRAIEERVKQGQGI
jgi:hypothetical protein